MLGTSDRPTLSQIGYGTGTNKFEHGYLPHYEEHVGYLRDEPITLLELGVQHGASLRMWESYFMKARILGLDKDPLYSYRSERCFTMICDVRSFEPGLEYDIVVDDCSHHPYDIGLAHTNIWPHVKPGGWYVVEDMNWTGSGGVGPEPFSDVLYRAMVHQGGDIIFRETYESELMSGWHIVFLQKAP